MENGKKSRVGVYMKKSLGSVGLLETQLFFLALLNQVQSLKRKIIIGRT